MTDQTNDAHAEALPSPGPGPEARDEATAGPLFPSDAAFDYRQRWESIQTGFVDQPRQSLQEADRLVSEVMDRLTALFEGQREELEEQWSAEEPSTEDLRVAFQRYRSFFQRLLAA